MSDDSTPTQLGPYEIDHRLHRGLLADVHVANGPEDQVAIKVARSDAGRTALQREHALLRRCNHPGIVRAHDIAADGSWFAMDWIKGQPLDDWCRDKSVEAIIEVGAQLADAVGHLHEHKIIHGDLKPRNVLIDQHDQVVLIDLGVSVLSGEGRQGFKGTMGYAAPELLRGAKPTSRTDVYGIGATLFAAVTGRPPFVAPDPAALSYLPLVSLPVPPSALNADIPSGLERILLTLLQRDPSRRPGSVARIGPGLRKSSDTPILPPLVGMHDEREQLRQAVIGATDAESRIVVLYGPAGCGRTALIEEAMEAGRRAGLRCMKVNEPNKVLRAMRSKGAPVAAWLQADDDGAIEVARDIASQRTHGLLLIRSNRPLPELGEHVVQLAPTPLDVHDIAMLLSFFGEDEDDAAQLRRETQGLPSAVSARIAGEYDEETIPPKAWAILGHLRDNGEMELSQLAAAMSVSELELLDHCEVLFSAELVASSDDGTRLRAI